jgi:uncharacterized protein YraI
MDDRLHGPVTAIRRHARAVAVAGAVVAVGAATVMTVAVADAAEGSGTCTDNVNVRAEPKPDARIITLCKRGTTVKVGATKNGFVELTSLKGWAAQEYVEVGGHTPRAPVERGGGRAPRSTEPGDDSSSGSGSGSGSGSSSGDDAGAASSKPSAAPRATPAKPGHDSDDADESDTARKYKDRDSAGSDDEEAGYRDTAPKAAAPRRIGLIG